MMYNFQKTENLLENFFDVKAVHLFSYHKKTTTTFTQDEFFHRLFYYAPSEWKFQKITETNIGWHNINAVLSYLTFSRNSCAFETEKEIRVFLPISVFFHNNFKYYGGDLFGSFPIFTDKSILLPETDLAIDFCLAKRKNNQTVNVYVTFPYLGASAIIDITNKPKEEANEEVKTVFNSVSSLFLHNEEKISSYFFKYYNVFECQNHTKLFAYYSHQTNEPLIFIDICPPKHSIMEYCYDVLGRTNLASLLYSNILITQEHSHGYWTIWYDKERTKESCDTILSVLREKFAQPNFIKFLKNIYSTEVIPYNLYDDVLTVSFQDLLYNLNGGFDEGNIW